jgi:hypothetical protein
MRAPPENANGACQGAAAEKSKESGHPSNNLSRRGPQLRFAAWCRVLDAVAEMRAALDHRIWKEDSDDTFLEADTQNLVRTDRCLDRLPQSAEGGMSKWRDKYKVHPAADIFPMMPDDQLRDLGDDIKRHGLKHPIIFQHADGDDAEALLLDGRNRLEAMERAGLSPYIDKQFRAGDPVAHIIGLNIRRRHLTQQERADLIIAAIKAGKKPRQVGEVSAAGGRGKKNELKARAVAVAKEHGVSKRTVERSLAKAEGPTKSRRPTPSPPAKPTTKTKVPITVTMPAGIEHARKHYVFEFVALGRDERRAEWARLYAAIEKADDEANGAA